MELNSNELDHAPTYEELIELYNLSMENDPTSPTYKRVLVRPKIHLAVSLCCLFAALVAASGLGILIYFLFHSKLWAVLSGIGVCITIFAVFAKKSSSGWCGYTKDSPRTVFAKDADSSPPAPNI